MVELIGEEDVNEVCVDTITYAIMGFFESWTPEQRVWWQEITNTYRASDSVDTLVKPTANDLPEAEAIAIAKAAVIRAYELAPNALDDAHPVADLYITDNRPDYRRWCVQLQLFREGSDSYVEKIYGVTVDENGEVIADPDVNEPHIDDKAAEAKVRAQQTRSPLFQTIFDYSEQAEHAPSRNWPVDIMAAYSAEVRPQVLAIIESGNLTPLYREGSLDLDVIANTTYAYGLPTETDIMEEDALNIAKKVLTDEFAFDEKAFDTYSVIYPHFDITDTDMSLWRFLFNHPIDLDLGMGPLYRVEVNAKTGDVVSLERFEFEPLFGELAYTLKWY